MKTIDEILKGCEHDGSYIPVSEVKRLMAEYGEEVAKNLQKAHIISSLPIIYVEQGDSTHGKDSNGKEYFIKHIGNDR